MTNTPSPALPSDVEELRAALERIRRTPAKPFPDPGAHSARAFGDAVWRAWSDIQRIATEALAATSYSPLRASTPADKEAGDWKPSWLVSALVSKENGDWTMRYGHRAVLVRADNHKAAEAMAFDLFVTDGYYLESVDATELTDNGVPGFVHARSASVTDASDLVKQAREIIADGDRNGHSAKIQTHVTVRILLEKMAAALSTPAHGEGELRSDNWLFDTGPANAAKGPRILDACYTAFNSAKSPNKEDGGASDWFNDTYPNIAKLIESMKRHAPSPPQQDGSGLVEALRKIAEQPTLAELSERGEDNESDFEDGYDKLIEIARKALASTPKTGGRV